MEQIIKEKEEEEKTDHELELKLDRDKQERMNRIEIFFTLRESEMLGI